MGYGVCKGTSYLAAHDRKYLPSLPLFKGVIFQNPKNAILRFTGPGMFTKTVREYFEKQGDESVAQAGVDFMGAGIFAMKGSWARYSRVPSYVDSNNQSIVL